jgi:hypothetical protein
VFIKEKKNRWDVAQVVEHLLCKCEKPLSSNPSQLKKKNRHGRRNSNYTAVIGAYFYVMELKKFFFVVLRANAGLQGCEANTTTELHPALFWDICIICRDIHCFCD